MLTKLSDVVILSDPKAIDKLMAEIDKRLAWVIKKQDMTKPKGQDKDASMMHRCATARRFELEGLRKFVVELFGYEMRTEPVPENEQPASKEEIAEAQASVRKLHATIKSIAQMRVERCTNPWCDYANIAIRRNMKSYTACYHSSKIGRGLGIRGTDVSTISTCPIGRKVGDRVDQQRIARCMSRSCPLMALMAHPDGLHHQSCGHKSQLRHSGKVGIYNTACEDLATCPLGYELPSISGRCDHG